MKGTEELHMLVAFTDNPGFGDQFIAAEPPWKPYTSDPFSEPGIPELLGELFSGRKPFQKRIPSSTWKYVFLVESAPRSQFDIFLDLTRRDISLPDGILSVAGTGRNFHGFKQRHWVTLPGNIHLSVLFSPRRQIPAFGSGFMVVAANSVVQAIDTLPRLATPPGIKWVNDILIGGKKVAGVLARTITRGETVQQAILGIGLNVESTPVVKPTPFVPEVTGLREWLPEGEKCNRKELFQHLIHFLWQNYIALLAGDYEDLLNFYRSRSIVIGKPVTVWQERDTGDLNLIGKGMVKAIGENLELYFQESEQPVKGGRLVLEGGGRE